jgi:hypothetical protein
VLSASDLVPLSASAQLNTPSVLYRPVFCYFAEQSQAQRASAGGPAGPYNPWLGPFKAKAEGSPASLGKPWNATCLDCLGQELRPVKKASLAYNNT